MANDSSILKPGQNGADASLTRVGFGTQEVVHARETQGTALAARAQAEIQARYIMAVQRPRNIDETRVRLLNHCKRSGFANIAEYSKPVGRDRVRGPSIRFVETALQEYGNVIPEATITYDDHERRVIAVSVTDLERNVTYKDDAIVEKFVERRSPKDGDEILGSRLNSYNERVYRIRATEDDFANKAASAVSKKTRNLGLRVLPADIVEEAMFVCKTTRESATAQDPNAARRQLVDAFASLRVMPSQLDDYLGHPFDQASPAEIEDLRAAFITVRDGEAKWVDLVEFQQAARGNAKPEEVSKPAQAAGDKVKARIEKAKEKAAAAAAAPPKKDEPKPEAKTEPAKTDSKQVEIPTATRVPRDPDDDDMTEDEKREIEELERANFQGGRK